ncbi:MAG TPA: hypothetical protein VHT03_14410 [Rhizomicrobium sp.]|jgi:hypothetical protein|nr:hypothetical protein [Rhizomicrobium sp.]
MSEIPAMPAAGTHRRDALAQGCFLLHFAVMVFIVFGWALPNAVLLLVYLAFLPAVVVQWQFNKNSCLLNNAESLLRTGSWRDPANTEEGAWLLGLVRSALGLELKPRQLDAFVYTVLVLFWGLGLGHLLHA